ncbi:hypothetical protein [Dyadobacter bucti]|uniref:hypothetical protein n=1 Tax=Dyadobacter bucti TaxID=2572203 RepID=UPI001107BF33|nr:hypothetical protein [Dyadobacter bucti]
MQPSFQESSFMRISKELIEKYHNGDCTPQEIKEVEDWLFNDETDEELVLPAGADKFKIQDEMWEEIATVFPEKKQHRAILFFSPFWRQAAAVLLLSAIGAAFFLLKYPAGKTDIIVIKNSSETINKDLDENTYTISLGPKSNVEINNHTGSIDFCGAMMINTKQDIEFTIKGTCASPDQKNEKVTLKKGLNYIALNYSSSGKADEVIILEEGSLMGLPPLVQRQLMVQFNI